jgi:hypothetical protein
MVSIFALYASKNLSMNQILKDIDMIIICGLLEKKSIKTSS